MATIYRTIYRTGFAALMLAGIVLASSAQAAGTCTASLAQYTAEALGGVATVSR